MRTCRVCYVLVVLEQFVVESINVVIRVPLTHMIAYAQLNPRYIVLHYDFRIYYIHNAKPLMTLYHSTLFDARTSPKERQL